MDRLEDDSTRTKIRSAKINFFNKAAIKANESAIEEEKDVNAGQAKDAAGNKKNGKDDAD